MEVGDLTIVQILLSAFSGFGIVLFSWIFGKKYFKRIKIKENQKEISQDNNEVQGDMAGGDIIKNGNIQSIDSVRRKSKVKQTGNKSGGDMAGGNIHKKD